MTREEVPMQMRLGIAETFVVELARLEAAKDRFTNETHLD